MTTLETLRAKRTELEAIGRKYGVSNIRVFGSVARGEETEGSDIDLLVNVESNRDLYDFIGFKQDAEALLSCEIDLVTEKGLYHLLRDKVLNEALPL